MPYESAVSEFIDNWSPDVAGDDAVAAFRAGLDAALVEAVRAERARCEKIARAEQSAWEAMASRALFPAEEAQRLDFAAVAKLIADRIHAGEAELPEGAGS